MADFNRTVTYTDATDLVDKLTTFLTTSGPGPDWEVEAVYSTSGDSFLRTANGSDIVYLYVFVDVVDSNMVFIGYVEDNAATNGWTAGTGPAAAVTTNDIRENGTGIYAGASGGSVTFIADESRAVVTATTYANSIQTTAWFGIYEPHTDPSNDTYPNMIASNASALLALNDISSGTIIAPTGSFARRSVTGFPSSVIKSRSTDGSDSRVYELWNGVDSQVDTIPHRGQVIPRDDRASPQEIFAYENWLTMTENGHGQSAFMAGLYRVSDKLTIGDTVTIGANDYLVIPLSPDAPSFGSLMLAGPIGTTI